MSLTFGFYSIRDLFAKLHRDADSLDEEVKSDSFFQFCCYGLLNEGIKESSTRNNSAN